MRSMTGYGKATHSTRMFDINTEIKSVNNRYVDLMIRLPREFSFLETRVREFFKDKVNRGKISVTISIDESSASDAEIVLDEQRLSRRKNMLEKVRSVLNLEQPVDLSHLLSFSDLFAPDYTSLGEETLNSALQESLQAAFNAFDKMRMQEAAHIMKDFRKRLNKIEQLLAFIEEKGRSNIRAEFDKMLKNVTELIGEQKLDRNRLEMEVALIADRVDITEETVRLKSHLKLFNETLARAGEVGKKITFILQEMLREANTMNSKTTDLEISHRVIELKEEIEKLREQAQNIE